MHYFFTTIPNIYCLIYCTTFPRSCPACYCVLVYFVWLVLRYGPVFFYGLYKLDVPLLLHSMYSPSSFCSYWATLGLCLVRTVLLSPPPSPPQDVRTGCRPARVAAPCWLLGSCPFSLPWASFRWDDAKVCLWARWPFGWHPTTTDCLVVTAACWRATTC